MRTFSVICMSLLLAIAPAFAQTVVKGTVTSADDGLPLIGVSVVEQGTTNGTVTDFDGNYELETAKNATIQFSYIGFKTQTAQAASVLNIIMESDAIMMEEVVSLGYSSLKKAELSSAVVTVSADALTDVTTSDVGNMLQGKVAGVQITNAGGQPGDAAQIRIRGTGSITAASDPVYVVDGVMGGSFSPQDVESISVLKDAGATGIYGAAAAGGVIVVTTKSGKKNEKITVDVKATAGAKQALYKNYHMMDSKELYEFHKSLYSKGVFNATYPKELLKRDYNWRDEFFRTGLIQDYYIAVKGGSEKVGYYTSLNYYGEEGTLITTGMQKFSANFNMNAQITKWLDLKARVNFAKSTVDYPSSWTMMDDAFNKMPWDNPYAYDAEGNQLDSYVQITGDTRSDNGEKWWSQNKWNSLYDTQYNYSRSNNFDLNANIQLNVHFTDWLSLSSTNTFSTGYYKSF